MNKLCSVTAKGKRERVNFKRGENKLCSLQPLRHIIKKRSLICDQEIGLCCSGNETVDRIDFSLL